MREAVIVSTARTPIGKAYRGAFNNTQGQELIGHALAQAVKRAGVAAAEVEDIVVGCAMQQGSTGGNVARQGLLRLDPAYRSLATPGAERVPSPRGG